MDTEDEGQVKFQIKLGWGAKYVNSEQFERADLRCRFGGMEVYFDNAALHTGKGVISIDASFSGVELYVPKEWTVENNLQVSLGAVEYKNEALAEPDKTVTLVGSVSFGAVEIIYV